MWADDIVSQVSCISSTLERCVTKVCVIEPPTVVLDAGYELNGDTGPREHDITVRGEQGIRHENEIEAHKEIECDPKTTLEPTGRIQV